MTIADVAIIGAGIAGASLAAALAPHCSVILLEAEDVPGFHSTGRSAAFWHETYGGPKVQPLTTASSAFLRDGGFLEPRGALYLAAPGDEALLDTMAASFDDSGVRLDRIGRAQLLEIVPGLREGYIAGLSEPSCADIDVAGLHALFLKTARQGGVTLMPSFRVDRIVRDGTGWLVSSANATISCTTVVNAAGAWADVVARIAGARPIGIIPYRRTIVQLRVAPLPPVDMPLTLDISGTYYFKPEGAGKLWLSPHDETPDVPHDVAPEELDVAIAIDRMQHVVDWKIEAVERRWAGLRSFAADRLPVYGFAPDLPGFFWCAGQGGFGIQTAPAAALLSAHLLLGDAMPLPDGIDPATYAPDRFASL